MLWEHRGGLTAPGLGKCSLTTGDWKDLAEKIEFEEIFKGQGVVFKSRFLSKQKGRMVYSENIRSKRIE